MKQTLLLFFLSFSFFLSAQVTLTLTVPESSLEVMGNEDQVIAEGTIKNESTDSVTLRWTRNIKELTDGWETAVCDKNLCYIPSIGEMDLVLAGEETSIFNIYVYPFGIANGEAVVEMTLTDVSNSENTVTGTYTFNKTSTSTFSVNRPEIKIFPNPTTDYISLTQSEYVEKLVIYNIVGRPVKTFNANYGNQYDVADLPRGMYLVRLVGNNDQTIKTVRLSKKNGA
ncbi:MAG: T9SS type A sorting domain-containing protein [Bacteroidota bacterium]